MVQLENKKKIKDFTSAERSEYNKLHCKMNYIKHSKKRLEYQKAYYNEHKEEIKKKANLRYRKKCGLL